MNKLKMGILGCANIAIRSVAPAIKEHPAFELAGFAGRDLNKTKETAAIFDCKSFNSYQDLIDHEDVDALYIPLPNSLHKEWVIKGLRSGKHILCEKSLGCSLEEVESMTMVAKESKRLLVENFQFRFHSQHKFVKELLKREEIGEIRCFRSSFGFPPFPDFSNIRYQKELGGGALLDAGAYPIKAAQVIIGNDFEVKAAILNISGQTGVDMFGGVYMQNGRGQFAELAFGFDNFYQCNYEIWGSKGKIISTRAFTAPPQFSPTVIIEKQNFREEKVLPSDNHFFNMLSHFSECIEKSDFEDENRQNLLQAALLEQVNTLSTRYNY